MEAVTREHIVQATVEQPKTGFTVNGNPDLGFKWTTSDITSVVVVGVAFILFLVFLWFFLSPIIRKPRSKRLRDSDRFVLINVVDESEPAYAVNNLESFSPVSAYPIPSLTPPPPAYSSPFSSPLLGSHAPAMMPSPPSVQNGQHWGPISPAPFSPPTIILSNSYDSINKGRVISSPLQAQTSFPDVAFAGNRDHSGTRAYGGIQGYVGNQVFTGDRAYPINQGYAGEQWEPEPLHSGLGMRFTHQDQRQLYNHNFPSPKAATSFNVQQRTLPTAQPQTSPNGQASSLSTRVRRSWTQAQFHSEAMYARMRERMQYPARTGVRDDGHDMTRDSLPFGNSLSHRDSLEHYAHRMAIPPPVFYASSDGSPRSTDNPSKSPKKVVVEGTKRILGLKALAERKEQQKRKQMKAFLDNCKAENVHASDASRGGALQRGERWESVDL